MNLIDAYRYLAALNVHRHFGRAAAACHVTQPALSNALRALESHFGCTIVRRGRQFEGFTAEGYRVLAAAHRMLREQEALDRDPDLYRRDGIKHALGHGLLIAENDHAVAVAGVGHRFPAIVLYSRTSRADPSSLSAAAAKRLWDKERMDGYKPKQECLDGVIGKKGC